MDKKTEYERRVQEAMRSVSVIMTEAKADGLAIDVEAGLDTGGQPQVRVSVLLR